jgi:hypothetical protein
MDTNAIKLTKYRLGKTLGIGAFGKVKREFISFYLSLNEILPIIMPTAKFFINMSSNSGFF